MMKTGRRSERRPVEMEWRAEALSVSEARLHALLEAAVDCIISIDDQGVIQTINPAATFPIELSVAEARQGDGQIFVGIICDITERKRAEEEVRTMTQQLWQAAKLASVGELAASIAHELNNPLATVSLRIKSALTHAEERPEAEDTGNHRTRDEADGRASG